MSIAQRYARLPTAAKLLVILTAVLLPIGIGLALIGSPIGALLSIIPLFILPLIILISSFIVYRRRQLSRFHRAAFWSGMAYLGVLALIFSIMAVASL